MLKFNEANKWACLAVIIGCLAFIGLGVLLAIHFGQGAIALPFGLLGGGPIGWFGMELLFGDGPR